MPEVELTIVNRLGLHARAAAKFIQTAGRFGAEISVERDGKSVNAKSIMGVMTLAAAQGSVIRISAHGEDADDALEALTALVNDRFGEAS